MRQQFAFQPPSAATPRFGSPFFDLLTDYAAYVALMAVATLTVILSLGFSANVAVGILEEMAKPAFFGEVMVRPAQHSTKSWSYSISR